MTNGMTNALTVIDKPQDLALFQQGYVQEYSQEVAEITTKLEEAEEALSLASALALTSQAARWNTEIVRLKRQLEIANQYLGFYQNGFLPIPRMPTTEVQYFYEEIPVEALRRLKEAKELGLFDEFAIVQPQPKRDPILVGIKRFTDGQEVHCFLAWWR